MLPTDSPSTSIPTAMPTTITPTQQPTVYPTHIPTHSPTHIEDYTHKLLINYTLSNLTISVLPTLSANITELDTVLEHCYLVSSQKALVQSQDEQLRIDHFNLLIVQVIVRESRLSATIHSVIYYNNESVGIKLSFISYTKFFANFTETQLRRFYDSPFLLLAVGKPAEGVVIDGEPPPQNTVFYSVSFTFLGVCMVIASVSFIYNQVPDGYTDNANSIAIVLYAMQVVDLFSDINLDIEMFSRFDDSELDPHRWKLYLAAFGSVLFLIVPYTMNIICAIRVKCLISATNEAAIKYFMRMHWLLNCLVVFSGSIYVSLSLVSSRVFAFDVFNSGLTMMELTKLTKLRLYMTILLENLPQLLCALIYINYNNGKASPNTSFALTMSILQLIAAVINYIVMITFCSRVGTGKARVIQYQLQMTVEPETPNLSTVNRVQFRHELGRMIRRRKERKAGLNRKLCSALGCYKNDIEIGYVAALQDGCIVNVVHYYLAQDMDMDLRSVRLLYHEKQDSVNTAFASHFKLNKYVATEVAVNVILTTQTQSQKNRVINSDKQSYETVHLEEAGCSETELQQTCLEP